MAVDMFFCASECKHCMTCAGRWVDEDFVRITEMLANPVVCSRAKVFDDVSARAIDRLVLAGLKPYSSHSEEEKTAECLKVFHERQPPEVWVELSWDSAPPAWCPHKGQHREFTKRRSG